MAPPEHILLGVSIANIYQSVQSFIKKDLYPYRMVLFVSIIFALLPDIDSFFGHYTSTNIFIGHRGITHSIFFVLSVSLFIILHVFLIKRIPHNTEYSLNTRSSLFLLALIFTAGISHIIADLPQPASIWGGIPVFFPIKEHGEYMRNGGWAKIGWYDLNIIWHLIYAALVSGVLLVLMHVLKKRKNLFAHRAAAVTVILINILTYANIILYISKSTYTDNESWNIKQEQYLKDSPPLVRSITSSGKNMVLKLFYLIRH